MEEIKVRTKKGNLGKVLFISHVTGRKTPSYLVQWTKTKAYLKLKI